MGAAALKYVIINLAADSPRILAYSERKFLREQCAAFDAATIPYATYERRVRKDGRYLWHPCETRFFDVNGGKH